MEMNFSIPAFGPAVKPPAVDVVRRVIEETAKALTAAITGGSMKIALSPNADGIAMLDDNSGMLSLVIGGSPRLIERADFSLDWDRNTLELHFVEERMASPNHGPQP